MATSGFGTLDGSGDSLGRITKVSCSYCNTENKIQEDDVQYTSSFRHITCKFCEEEIVLDDDLVAPGKTSVVTSESMSTSGQQSNDGVQEEGVERVVGLRPRGRDRKLKSSASYSECGTERNGPMTIQQSASLGAIAQTGSSELTVDSLMQLSEMIKEQPCPHCGCAERSLLNPVEGMRDLFHCLHCERLYGIDDGMNFFDFQEFLSTGYRMDPCSFCGNDDPEKFTLERSRTGGMDSTTDLVVQCSVCHTVSPKGLGLVVEHKEEDLGAVEVCSSCGNRDSEKFEVQLDARNRTMATLCMVCSNKEVTEVTGQICCCKEASTDYDFDEYGYICKIKCNVCGAVMETNDNAHKKSSSDGSSWGRTRIRSLDMIRAGDHIAWHQWLGYWHHAIVIEVQGSLINLINYNGPSAHKGEIVDEWRELDLAMEEVYRIDYHRDAGTYDPKVVVERAKSRLGEHSYNLLTNNCEHFARWCVTGQHRSVQVQTFYEAILNRVKVAAKGRLSRSLIGLAGKGELKLAAAVGDRGLAFGQRLLKSGDNAAKGVVANTAAGGAKSVSSGLLSRGLSAGFAVGYEVYSVIADIRQAHRQRVDGAIDRNEFLKITIKRSCEGVGSLVGTAVTLAIPVANNVVGLTIGTIIGKAAGGMVGRNAACLIDKVSSKS